MVKVLIKSIELENFKGFVKTQVDFDEHITCLYGKSGCGKSTIRDAWLWVCGIDIESPYPSLDNKVIPDIQTCVKCRISIGNNEYVLSRMARQKWKNIEDIGRVFNGFEANNFSIDNVSMSATVFRDKICEIFKVDKYEYIKFLCDTNYFNNELDYKKRRDILFKICKVDDKIQKLIEKDEFELIRADINKGLTTLEITKALNSSDKLLSDTKKANLTRIQERSNDLSVDYDFDMLREQLKQLEFEYKDKNSQLQELKKESLLSSIKKQIIEKTNLLNRLEIADRQKQSDIELKKATLDSYIKNIRNLLKLKQAEIKELENKKKDIEDSEFSPAICPLCKQEIKSDKLNTINEFEKQKTENISSIKGLINSTKADFESKKDELENKLVELNNISGEFVENSKIAELRNDIDKLNQEYDKNSKSVDDKQLKFELQSLENSIRDISYKLSFEKLKESAENRIRQLEKDNLEIAKLERANSLKRRCNENYLLTTIKLATNEINNKFTNITWNLFDTLNADAEKNYKEECEAMFDNKLYSQCSTGQKLITNFYTVLGLQKAFNISLPIFFDEAQSSTFNRKCEQQLIELVTNKKETNITGVRIKKEIENNGN